MGVLEFAETDSEDFGDVGDTEGFDKDIEKYMSDLYQASEDLFIHVSKSDAILDEMDLDLLNDDEDYDEEEEGEN